MGKRFCDWRCSNGFVNGKRNGILLDPVTLICEQCGIEFQVQRCYENRRFCLRSCADLNRVGKLMVNVDLDKFVEHYNQGLSMTDICTLLYIERDMFRKLTKRLISDGRIVPRERVKAWTYVKSKS